MKPKRILALDGGGIRGALTLGFLERIETILREREGNPNLKLCEHYDMIGGTSTGAIIASGLAIGMTASEIKELYLNLGSKIFGKKFSWVRNPVQRYKATFDFRPLEEALKEVFGDITIGSDKIKTGLCIVAKRADTLSTWPIINHPEGKYFNHNKGMLLRKVIRASAAAPSYFVPQQIDVGFGQMSTFIDGGVSLANNPALLMFLVATLKGFPYHWETGEDKLALLSLGTGTYTKRYDPDKVAKQGLLGWAAMLPELFMEDANYLNQVILQYLSNSPRPVQIDREMGDLKDDMITEKAALHYMRYNVMLEENELNSIGMTMHSEQVATLHEMSNHENKELLYEIGRKAAAVYIEAEHIR